MAPGPTRSGRWHATSSLITATIASPWTRQPTMPIRCYAKVGFREVGVMHQYERGLDGTSHNGLLMELLAEDLTG